MAAAKGWSGQAELAICCLVDETRQGKKLLRRDFLGLGCLAKFGNLPMQEILVISSLWLFTIYHKFPEIPVGMSMVNVFLVRFTGKFPGQTEILKR